jgi:hypothetical protein
VQNRREHTLSLVSENLARQQWGEADPRRSQAVALQDAIDGPSTGERADAQGLQFGEDGSGPGQAVAGGRRGVGLEPASDGEDGPLQFGRDAPGDMVVGPRQVVEALGPSAGIGPTTCGTRPRSGRRRRRWP